MAAERAPLAAPRLLVLAEDLRLRALPAARPEDFDAEVERLDAEAERLDPEAEGFDPEAERLDPELGLLAVVREAEPDEAAAARLGFGFADVADLPPEEDRADAERVDPEEDRVRLLLPLEVAISKAPFPFACLVATPASVTDNWCNCATVFLRRAHRLPT